MLLLTRVFAQLDGGANSFMKNHPSGIERYKYLKGEAARCTELQARLQPARTSTDVNQVASNPAAPVTVEAPPTPANSFAPPRPNLVSPAGASVVTWKLVQNPNSHWTFKITDTFLYGEHQSPQTDGRSVTTTRST